MRERLFGIALTALILGSVPLSAQVATDGMSLDYQRAVSFEGSGQPARAVEILRPILEKSPADFRALMLIEQCLIKLDKRAEMLPILARAVRADSAGTGVISIAIRVFGGLQMPDSARKYAAKWLTKAPGDATPFREWSEAATAARDRVGAVQALEEGRKLLGNPDILAAEIAQAAQFAGDYTRAVQEWSRALKIEPLYRQSAAYLLGQTPTLQRASVSQALTQAGTPETKWLHGMIQIRWGEPTIGAAMVLASLPRDNIAATTLLQDVLELLTGNTAREALMAKGTVLEAMASRQMGSAINRLRLEAGKAYADAGSDREARRVFGLAGADPAAPKGVNGGVSSTTLGVLLAQGKAAEADTMLRTLKASLGEEERDEYRRRIALLFARQGEFDRATVVLGVDSTVDGIDIIGRINLFRGDLATAAAAFRYAGPFDDIRAQSVSRVTILALLQAIGKDSSARLGAAFMAVERKDSATALRLFDSLAATFSPAGAAETRLLAGQIARAMGDTARALAFFTAADVASLPGTAAAARLEHARVLLATGKKEEARRMAESIILDFPESAVLPDARRLRDEVRGTVPGRGG